MPLLKFLYKCIDRGLFGMVVAVILLTKCFDTGAYFTGRALGRHKLIPWLSPGKTWEGVGGGVALSAIVAGVAAPMM